MDADVDGTAKRAAAELLQDVHSMTQKFLGYFPKVSANKCTDTSPQEFLCIRCGRFSLSLCQTKLPQGSSDTGPSTGKSQGWELSWTAALPLCTHWASSQRWHNCLGNSQGKLHFTLQDSSGDVPCGNGLVWPSCVPFVDWGKNSSFEKNCWFSIVIAKVETLTNLEKKKKLYMLMIKTINTDHIN